MGKTRRRRTRLASATADLGAPKRHTRSISSTARVPFSSPITPKRCMTSTSSSTLVPATAKSVLLTDWWLRKVDGKGLAVGGFASTLGVGVREYNSSLITKRHCATTLETAQGTMITINGLLNMSRTHQNGFPSEVCNQFLHGFPYNWEEHAYLGALNRTCAAAEPSIFLEESGNNSLRPLNDLPVSGIRDCLLSTLGCSGHDFLIKSIYNDTLGTLRSDTFQNSGV